jgi:hypothetical protein
VPELSENQQTTLFRKFTLWLGLATCALILLPSLYGLMLRPANSLYLGIQYNIDDHMVYSAWMRQAMEGRILFENRFTTIEQPGLTLHVYFLVLGWIAKLTGIPVAMHLGRIAFCFLSIQALGRLIEKAHKGVHARKLGLALAVFGGGLGFMVWHMYGVAIVKPGSDLLAGIMSSRLPTDVWQPEGFFLYSALTNGLFMVSAFLILMTLNFALEARNSGRAVLYGALCLGLLMNIHSYDVLLLGLIFIGFCVALLASKQFDRHWLAKMLLIGLGIVPFALWFIYVLRNDPVFQARAATETFSANYRSFFFGFAVLMLMALPVNLRGSNLNKMGVGLLALLHITLFALAPQHLADGFFMQSLPWLGCFSVTLFGIYLYSKTTTRENTMSSAHLLLFAWAAVGLIAPYFPALFQRKLMMMLGVPWGVLAGFGISKILESRERGQRNLLTSLGIVVAGATGIQWFSRELTLIRNNVSNTTVHSVYLPKDIVEIIARLEPLGRKAVVIALPGMPAPRTDEQGQPVLDIYDTPIVSDLNPFFTGLAGSRAIAGHWSETPNYAAKRKEISAILTGKKSVTEAIAMGITHAIVPNELNTPLGIVEFQGTTYSLIKLRI